MPSKIKWSVLNSVVTLVNGDASAPTMKGLANGSSVLSVEIDNTSGREQYAEFEALARCVSVPTGSPYLECHIVQAVDGSNYEDGDASTRPGRMASFVIPLRLVNSQQRAAVTQVWLPPTKFKVLVANRTGVDLTATDGENLLTIRTYSPEAQ